MPGHVKVPLVAPLEAEGIENNFVAEISADGAHLLFSSYGPPYLALGDDTVLKKGMTFSEEPGLYDPKARVGFNWSDCVVTGEKSGFRMSGVPYSKEWCWIKI